MLLTADPPYQIPHLLPNISHQHRIPILRDPYNMICTVKCRMACLAIIFWHPPTLAHHTFS
jgi:hypothetical protein